MNDLDDIASNPFCYLTTRGRVSGQPHEIEIWFAARGSTIYLLSGGGERADWVKNLLVTPEVRIRVGELQLEGSARNVDRPEEDAWVRQALLDKYNPTYAGDLTDWSRTALPIAIDITSWTGASAPD